MVALAAVTGAFAVFLLCAYMIRARAFAPGESRIRGLTPRDEVRVEAGRGGQAVLRRSASSIPALRRMLDTGGYTARWAFELERADVKLRPGEYLLVRLVLGVFAFGIIALVGRSAPAVVVGLPVGAMVYMLPAYWLRQRTAGRIRKINNQLVETVALMANSLRAGFAFGQGIDVAAKRVGPPMSVELNRLLLDINLGAATEDALLSFNERIGSDDVDMVVTAILIQRSSGGNLAEVLENVTETMRERERLHGEVKTMTSQQRLTGWILSVWPALVGLLFFAISPARMTLLWTTTPGLVLLGIWVVLNTLGIITLQRILRVDI